MTRPMRWRLVWPVSGGGSQRGSGVRLAGLGYGGRVVGCLGFVLVACLVFGAAPASAATRAPGWGVDSFASPTDFAAGCEGNYQVTVINVGSLPTVFGPGTPEEGKWYYDVISDTLPAGVTAQSVSFFWSGLPK